MSSNLPINSHGRAPSHRKPAMPRASEISARLAAGESLETIAAGCERTVATLRGHLNERGYDSTTGLPLRPEWATRKPFTGRGWSFPAWADQAACAETDPEAFYPEPGARGDRGTVAEAKRVCGGCEVQTQCLEWALLHDERYGVWGGLSANQRARLKKQRAAS